MIFASVVTNTVIVSDMESELEVIKENASSTLAGRNHLDLVIKVDKLWICEEKNQKVNFIFKFSLQKVKKIKKYWLTDLFIYVISIVIVVAG